MAATEHARRRFITRKDVEDAAAAGRAVRVEGRDVLTDEATQRAMDLGVRVERADGRPTWGTGGAASGVPEGELRRAVRAAVVAELGREPAGLDEAIDRVLRRQR